MFGSFALRHLLAGIWAAIFAVFLVRWRWQDFMASGQGLLPTSEGSVELGPMQQFSAFWAFFTSAAGGLAKFVHPPLRYEALASYFTLD